jgi:hypothetical protein
LSEADSSEIVMPRVGDVVWYWVFPNTGEVDPNQPCAAIVSLAKGPRLVNVGVVTQHSLWHWHEDISINLGRLCIEIGLGFPPQDAEL